MVSVKKILKIQNLNTKIQNLKYKVTYEPTRERGETHVFLRSQ